VVEVISPYDRTVEILAKVLVWLKAGAALVWVADPVAETITVYSNDAQSLVLRSEDILDGGAILPGFSIPVREIFAM
jgi:Uma2 family endonuclease